jgi:glycerol-3-phosphate acyltransferase PlsY
MGSLLWIAAAYLLGSIPMGLVVGRLLCGVDPRGAGSRSTGSTNVARLCGFKYGVLTLVLDLGKGWLPVSIAMGMSDSAFFVSLVAFAALVGHAFSVFMGFRGGKAVATTIGVFIPLAFGKLVIAVALCIAAIVASGFVSLGSLTLVTALPVLLLLGGDWAWLPLSVAVMALVYWLHRENIVRLARGEEKSWRKSKYDSRDAAAPADGPSSGPSADSSSDDSDQKDAQ